MHNSLLESFVALIKTKSCDNCIIMDNSFTKPPVAINTRSCSHCIIMDKSLTQPPVAIMTKTYNHCIIDQGQLLA